MHRGEQTIDVIGTYKPKRVQRYCKIIDDLYGNSLENIASLRWLDIGCGFGEFIEALQVKSHNQLTLKGSEPNAEKIKSARDRNLDVNFIDLDNHREKYDFISLLNVYSHLPNPVVTLKKWKQLLKSSGEILLETGHSSHLNSKDHHKPYYLPDHLSFANEEIIKSILSRQGFNIIKVKLYRHTQFPERKVIPLLKELIKLILGRSSLKNIFPVSPNRDMYIRAKLVA
jgi:SAM-dependent methyltransferase